MQILAPYQYPDPIYFQPVNIEKFNGTFMTVRFHTIADGTDYILDVNPIIPGVLSDAPNGNLLIDMWADADGDDWIASTVFKMTGSTLTLAEDRSFGEWHNSGIVELMALRAKLIAGYTKTLDGIVTIRQPK